MTDMKWALEVAAHHPELEGAIVTEDAEWLDVLLADGRTFRFRPFELISQEAPEDVQRDLLTRLITIGARDAAPAPSKAEADALGDALDGAANTEPGAGAGGGTGRDGAAGPAGGRRGPAGGRHGLASIFGELLDSAVPGPEPAGPVEQVSDESTLVPIVRPASYFVQSISENANDSIIYVPVTDFLGIGIAADMPQSIVPVRFSDLGLERTDYPAGALFKRALDTLRQLNSEEGHPGVEIQVGELAGATVNIFMSPDNYQSSWFADFEIVHKVAEMLTEEDPDSIPLFIPATRTSFFVVRDTDPKLPALFRYLAHDANSAETIYPLPHTVAADGWREWIPLPDHPAARILSELRATYRTRIYDAQQAAMIQWPADLGQTQTATPARLSASTVTLTHWQSSFGYGSIPDVDYVSFIDDNAGTGTDAVVLRTGVARELWPEGFSEMEGIWPRRWAMTGFPDAETLEQMRAQAGRAF